MKKTQRLVLFKNIWATKVSFISILMFVAMGIAMFLGIKWNGPAFQGAIDKYLQEYKFHDFAVNYPFGITEDDVKAIDALGVVSAAEGGYTADGMTQLGDKYYLLAIRSLTKEINIATAVEGVLPAAANEVGVEQRMAQQLGLSLGDKIKITSTRAGVDSLNGEEFIITAFVAHPAYVNLNTLFGRGVTLLGNGELNYYALMSDKAFNKEAYDNCFSTVYVRDDALRAANTLSEEYKESAVAVAAAIQALGNKRGHDRFETVKARYETEIKNAELDIENGENELAEAERQLAEAQKTFADGDSQILAAERKIAQGRKAIADAEKEYAAGVAACYAAERQLIEGKATIDRALRSLNAKLNDWRNYLAMLPQFMQTWVDNLLHSFGIDRNFTFSYDYGAARSELVKVRGIMKQIDDELNDEATELNDLNARIAAYILNPTSAEQAAIEQILIQKELPHADLDNFTDSLPEISARLVVIDRMRALFQNPITLFGDLINGIDTYNYGEAALNDAWAKLMAALDQIENGKLELKNSEIMLRNSRAALASGAQTIESGKKELEANKLKLADGKKQLEEAKAAFVQLLRYDRWTVEKRVDNISFGIADAYGATGERLCYSMSLLFVFVGVMICYTAVARTVRERRTQTGVQKALGFTRKEIVRQYMAYAVLAVTLGSILGWLLGYFVIEGIMNGSFSNYLVGTPPKYYNLKDWLLISGAELALICLATWLACRKLLSEQAIDLIRGNDPSVRRARFYEKQRWWSRCSLYTQTTINNLVNDKSRVIATLVSVIGCSALIIMALFIQSSIARTPELHFSNVFLYEWSLTADDSKPEDVTALRETLDSERVSYTTVRQKTFFIEDNNGKLNKTDVVVPCDSNSLNGFIRFNDSSSGETIGLPERGVLLSETYTKYHDVRVGGTLKLLGMDGQYRTVEVAGIVEHYLPANQIFMSPSYYQTVMGEPAAANSFLINLNGVDPIELEDKIADVGAYYTMSNDRAKWTAYFATIQQTTTVMVYVLFILAAIMALVVLLNLNVSLINEKAKELIVMRINGFSVSSVKKYIYRDNIALTALGVILGVGAGIGLGLLVIASISIEGSNISTKPSLFACLAGVAITAFLSLITNLIALRRIDKLRVSDLNKQ